MGFNMQARLRLQLKCQRATLAQDGNGARRPAPNRCRRREGRKRHGRCNCSYAPCSSPNNERVAAEPLPRLGHRVALRGA